MFRASLLTPFGDVCLHQDGDYIVAVTWERNENLSPTPLLSKALEQLAAYSSCGQTVFDLPLGLPRQGLQRAVCEAMQAIPSGETRTYGEIAKDVGASAQAVGQACGANPLPVLIPCHRVMGAGGKLVGFSGRGGVETKVALLRHEGAAGLLI